MIFAADPNDILGRYPGWTIVLVTAGIVLALTIVWFIIRQVGAYFVKSAVVGDLPATLILVLALITLVLVVGGLLTDSESAWTVAATGVGAIAASLTAYFQRSNTAIEQDRLTHEPLDKKVDAAGLDTDGTPEEERQW